MRQIRHDVIANAIMHLLFLSLLNSLPLYAIMVFEFNSIRKIKRESQSQVFAFSPNFMDHRPVSY